ncbi:HAD family hydrolase [Nonomuraea zeae]|uniref:HAD family hydrolase n=1 Tax=Nonomuraea zeae TaxID=1642303 RepID=A0A5S4FW22_9ACTN|nr:HAD family hydrolase [Nonomuraea zeae]TMR24842.1 HAD family hydrolase [Nonomuraea zeae]
MLALFDLDNTLIDRLGAFRRWAAEFAAERGLGEQEVSWLVSTDADGSVPMDTFFTLVRDRYAPAEPAGELWRGFRARLPHLVSCRAEVLAGLDRLRAAGWRTGIVTNGMTDNQTAKIERTGLAGRVDGWAISDAEGVRKPDVRLFEIAAARCGSPLAGGWMVGDDLANDIAGGRAAGLRTIWIDRGLTAGTADHVVTDVLDAVDILIEVNPGRAGR